MVATITEPNYIGSASGNLIIAYAVTYNGNGSTGGSVPANQNKLHDINLPLASNTGGLVKTGYIFTGWNTMAEGTGTDYPAGSTYSANAPITLFAKWTPGADGTWLPTAAGPFNWSDSANWSGGAIASGVSRTASFTPNITATQTVNVDTPITIGNITFTDSTTSSHDLTISGANSLTLAHSSAAPVIDVTTSGRTLTISSTIAGTNGFSKTGTGNLILSGDNTYTGVTTLGLTTGQITVAHNNALGSTAAGSHTTITNNGNNNHWIWVNTGITTPENITLTGTGLGGYDSPLRAAGTGTYSGTITLNLSRGMRIGPANWTGTITGTITKIDAATPTLVFIGANTVSNPITIGGANLSIMNGTTTLNAVNGTGIGDTGIYRDNGDAILRLGVTNALRTDGNLSISANSVTSNARLNLNGNNQTIKGLISGASNTWTVNNDANNGSTSTLTVGNGGGDYSFGGRIIDATTGNGLVALVKTGAGNQTLTNTNTFTGGTRIDDGALTLGHATDTLANTGAINVNGGTLALGANNDTVGAVTLTSGSITGSGTASQGVLTGSSYDIRSGSVSAKLAGAGVALTKTTGGTATLSADNTYTGVTTIQSGTLALTGATQATTAITFTGGSLGLDTGVTVNASSAAVNLTNGTIQVTGSTGAASYTLLTAASITGTPTLASPVSGYTLQVVSGNQLRLVQTPFGQWAAANGLTGDDAAPGADPDGDGLTNLQEFAFATNPTGGRPGPIRIDQDGKVVSTGLPDIKNFAAPAAAADFRAVFPRRKDYQAAGLIYTVEFSADLTRWTEENDGLQVLSTASTGDVDAVSVPFPPSVPVTTGDPLPPKFFRVVVATTP